MDELQTIVNRLKEDPFNKSYRAVDFDGKTPEEHLQVLNDVLSSLNADLKSDVRIAAREQVVESMMQFLLILKCKHIPMSSKVERMEWSNNLRKGEKNTIYSVLHWVLSNYEHLSRRSYLANYLMPINVPSEYLMQENSNIAELSDSYKELQAEFLEVHKMYESTRSNIECPVSDVIHSTEQLTIKKQQLLDRLERERTQGSNNANFQQILEETSKMRQAQEDEDRLEEQKNEQVECTAAANQRLKQVRHIFDVLQSMTIAEKPIDTILSELEVEAQRSVNHLEINTMRQQHTLELKLLQAEKECLGSIKTDEDIAYMEEMVLQMEDILQSKQAELDNLSMRMKNVSKLSIFKKHADIAASNLRAKREDAEAKIAEKEHLIGKNQKLRDAIEDPGDGDNGIQRPDGTTMTRQEIKTFQDKLKKQSKLYEESKQGVDEMKKETLVLKRTEQILKSRHHNLEEFLRKEEEKAGVTGFRDAHEKLEQTSKQTATLNELKSQTLEDISNTVKEIALTLEAKKRDLEPKVKHLKEVRQQFQELQERHQSKKARYDKLANKLMNNNKSLENECSRLQTEWVEKERSYHLLCATDEIMASKLKCLSMEETWRKGEETFLPDFGSLKEYYGSKIVQQQGLTKELRKQKYDMRLKEEVSSNQKKAFFKMKQLLELCLNENQSSSVVSTLDSHHQQVLTI